MSPSAAGGYSPKGVASAVFFNLLAVVGAQLDTAPCETSLLALTDVLNDICCAEPAECNTKDVPSACSHQCAEQWVPFANECSAFIEINFDYMEAFTQMCRATCDAGADCDGDGMTSPPVEISFLRITVSLANGYATSDEEENFKNGLQQDIARALHMLEFDVIIVSLSPTEFTADLFSLSAEICDGFTDEIKAQLQDDSSVLSTGTFSGAILHGQKIGGSVTTFLSGMNSDAVSRDCLSKIETTASFDHPMWQAGGVSAHMTKLAKAF